MSIRERKQFMRYPAYPVLISCIPIMLGSCTKSSFTDPYMNSAKSSNRVWEVSSSERKKIDRIDLHTILDIPHPDDLITLGDLFDIGLMNSPNTQTTWVDAREAAAMYSSSLSTYLPEIAFDGEFDSNRNGVIFDNKIFTNNFTSYGPQVTFNYLIWDSGKRRANAEMYYQTLQAANWMHNEMIQDVMRDVADAYYTHLSAKATFEAYNSDLLNAEQTYVAASLKQETGIYDQTDMLQAKTNYLQKKVQVTGQDAAVKNTFVELLSELGIPCDVTFNLGDFPTAPPMDPFDMCLKELTELAFVNRPNLKSAKADIIGMEAKLKVAKTDLYPKLVFSGQAGNTYWTTGQNAGGNYNLQVDFTFPIFTGFYHMNQIRGKENELKKAVTSLRSAELSVVKEVKIYHNNFIMAMQMVEDTKSYKEAAEIEFDAMIDRYKLEVVSILDLLSSQAYLSDARAQYVKAQKEYYVSIINIAFATGLLTNSCPWTMEADQ